MDWSDSGHHNRAVSLLLAGYAAGTLSPPLHALTAGHLALSPKHRMYVANLEAGYGAALEAEEPRPLPSRSRMLEAIFAAPESGIRVPSSWKDPILPPPLARYLGGGFPDLSLRRIGPGVLAHAPDDTPDDTAVIYRVRAGNTLPEHAWCGAEVALVLHGAFSDGARRYRRGDIAVRDAEQDRPSAEPDQDCIYFAVTDAPLHLAGPLGRWVKRFFGSA